MDKKNQNEKAATDKNKTVTVKKWFDDKCKRELRKRNKLDLEILTEEKEETKIRPAKESKEKIIETEKVRYNEKILEEIEEIYKNRKVRNLYQRVKRGTRGFQNRPVFYKNKDGPVVAGEEEILKK